MSPSHQAKTVPCSPLSSHLCHASLVVASYVWFPPQGLPPHRLRHRYRQGQPHHHHPHRCALDGVERI